MRDKNRSDASFNKSADFRLKFGKWLFLPSGEDRSRMDELDRRLAGWAHGGSEYDSGLRFADMPGEHMDELVKWIDGNLSPIKTINYRCSSYGMKHLAERDMSFGYVSNLQMKVALHLCGFRANDESLLNPFFNVSQRSLNAVRVRQREERGW